MQDVRDVPGQTLTKGWGTVNIQNSSAILAIVVKPQPLEFISSGFFIGENMRFLFAFLLCVFCVNAFAGDEFVVDRSDVDMLMSKRSDIQQDLVQEYEELLTRVRELDSSYAKYLESQNNLSTEQKLQKLRSWAAQKAFEYYEQLFRDEINAKSEQSGRKIRNKFYNNSDLEENFIWLDRGDLEQDKCRRDGWNVCKYPDGFEDYYIETQFFDKGGETYYKITFHKDMPDTNTTQICDVDMDVHNYNYTSGTRNSVTERDDITTSMGVSCFLYRYDDYYAWKNQEVEDILAGKMDIVEWVDYGGPFGRVGRTRTSEQDWKSNYLPTTQIIGYDISVSRSSEETQTKK